MAAFEYEANAESLVGAYKVGGRSYLSHGMGALMTLQWLEQGHSLPDVLVPVPSSPLSTFKRGYSSSVLLAESIGKIMNRPIWNGLRKELAFLKQSQLSKQERLALSSDSIYIDKDPSLLKDKHVLLIDDVMTTGQTLHVASSKLLEGFPRVIDALVFAR